MDEHPVTGVWPFRLSRVAPSPTRPPSSNPGATPIVRIDVSVSQSVEPPVCNGFLSTIVGTSGKDVVAGTSGADVIVTFGGDDKIYGGPGIDHCNGGSGPNTIINCGGSGGDEDD